VSEGVEIAPGRGQSPAAACYGKQGFDTYPQAQRVLKRMLRRRDALEKHRRLQIFRCPYCKGLHIGGTSK
jgi:hypothetical protein